MSKRIETWELGAFNYGKDKIDGSITVVSIADYETLKAENERLKSAVKVLRGALKNSQNGLDLYGSCTLPPDDVSGVKMYTDAGKIRMETRKALTETEKILGGEDDNR